MTEPHYEPDWIGSDDVDNSMDNIDQWAMKHNF
jgi:hypothetical protein